MSAEEIAQDHPGSVCHVTEGGSTVAVEPNGNIWGVCGRPSDTLRGRELVQLAVENGGIMLDSYDGNHGFYVKCGFEPVSWCKWNGDFKPPDWKEEFAKEEDIIFYKYVGIGNVNPKYIDKKSFKKIIEASPDYGIAENVLRKTVRRKA